MAFIRFLLVIIAVPAVASCATVQETAIVDDVHMALNPYDTIDNRPGIMLTAQLQGRLESNGKCIIVRTATRTVTPLWPEGTIIDRSSRKQRIVLPEGRGAAAFNRQVSFGGATLPASRSFVVATSTRDLCPQAYFIVSTIAKRGEYNDQFHGLHSSDNIQLLDDECECRRTG